MTVILLYFTQLRKRISGAEVILVSVQVAVHCYIRNYVPIYETCGMQTCIIQFEIYEIFALQHTVYNYADEDVMGNMPYCIPCLIYCQVAAPAHTVTTVSAGINDLNALTTFIRWRAAMTTYLRSNTHPHLLLARSSHSLRPYATVFTPCCP